MKMNVIVSQEIEHVCPEFVGACVEADVVNTPYNSELWQEIEALGNRYRQELTTESLRPYSPEISWNILGTIFITP